MKYIIYLILIVFCTSLFSCNDDFLNTIPRDRVSESIFWKTEKDAEYACNAIYAKLPSAWDYLMWDAMSDIGCVTLDWRSESAISRNQFTPTNGRIASDWSSLYMGIQTANNFIDNVDKVPTDEATINNFKGQALFLRGWFYLRLTMLYGNVPLIKEPLPLSESYHVLQSSKNEIIDFIISDLNQAAEYLPVKQPLSGRVTKGAAYALLARTLLYSEQWAEAAKAAKQVMDLNVYEIYPSYENLFTYGAESNSEIIFEQQFEKSIMSHRIALDIAPNSIRPGSNNTVPTKKAVDAFAMSNGLSINDPASGFDPLNPYDNRDPRLKYAIYVPGELMANGEILNSYPGSKTGDAVDDPSTAKTRTGFYQRKYFTSDDLSDLPNSGINLVHIRYADVLLMYAEAKIESNDIDDSVINAINQVRSRADVNMPGFDLSLRDQDELRKIVRNERLTELCFEGLRYFDIRRWGIAEDVIPGKVYGMTYVEDGELKTVDAGINKLFQANRDYLWPLPADELILNDNLVQNPNW